MGWKGEKIDRVGWLEKGMPEIVVVDRGNADVI